MKKVLLAIAAFMVAFTMNAQILFEDFNSQQTSDLPAGWTTFKMDEGNTTYYTDWSAGQAWIVVPNWGAAVSTSYFTNDGFTAADRWLVTPAVTLPAGGNYVMEVAAASGNSSYPESFEIRVATNRTEAPTTAADFDETVLLNVDPCPSAMTTFAADISAYAGQTVYLAVRHTGYNGVYMVVDEVKVRQLQPNDMSLTGVTVPAYAGMGNDFTVNYTVKNQGSQPLTSFTVEYAINNGTPVSAQVTSLNVDFGQTYDGTLTLNIAELGDHTVTVTVSNPNEDATITLSDNTGNGSVTIYDATNTKPRTTIFEEFTTAQCVNCPGAHLRVHNALTTRPNVIVVAHHAGYYTDAMTVQENSDLCWFYNAGGGTYAPASMLDRRHFDFSDNAGPVFYPGNDVGDCMDAALAVPSFTEVNITDFNYNDETREATFTVSGTIGAEAGLTAAHLSIYLVQDSIVSTQSGASANPSQVVGTQYRHMDVMRASILDGTYGKVINNTGDFSEQISYTLPEKVQTLFLQGRCRFVAFVSNYVSGDAGNCAIENATKTADFFVSQVGGTQGIDNAAQVQMSVYPNPATDYVVIDGASEMTEVQVVNALGQVVYRNTNVAASQLVINTTDFANGLYIVTVKSQNGTSTQRLSVVR